ncbi:MAG: hypothetical protein D3913_04130 [Candidatus Electrothrix sp. LOE1_4_5]|nr:hypothetical protein [Candidatus Electrothrix gigas]
MSETSEDIKKLISSFTDLKDYFEQVRADIDAKLKTFQLLEEKHRGDVQHLQTQLDQANAKLAEVDKKASRPNISTNRHPQGLEHNVLFHADKRFKVTQSGPASLDLASLFDGRMAPSYSSTAPTKDNPLIITIEDDKGSWSKYHTQAGAWFGFTTRYWPAKRFKIEGNQIWSGKPKGWQVLADYSSKDYSEHEFIIKLPHAQYKAFRITIYSASSPEGKIGISEVFYINPEAAAPYTGL